MQDSGISDSLAQFDTESVDSWYNHLRREAMRQLPGSLLDRIGPDDLVQETFLIGLCNREKTVGRSDREIRAWLTVILRNRTRMAIRHYCRRQGNSSLIREQNIDPDLCNLITQDDADQSFQLMHEESVEKLRLHIERLPPHLHQIVVWRFFDSKNFEWIADQLKISPRQSRRLLQQAMNHILEGWNHMNFSDD